MKNEELNKKKLNYMDYDPIINLSVEKEELKKLQINNLFYSSCKALYENGKYYASDYARATKQTMNNPFELGKLEDNDLLLKDLRYFKVLAKQH